MPTKVPVGNGKYCYTGPTCNMHGQHWKKAAEVKLQEATEKLKTAETYEEFTAIKSEINAAQAEYDKTAEGWTQVMSAAMKEDADDKIKTRYENASRERNVENERAVRDFLNSKTVEERAADVFRTKDPEKIELYLSDSNPTVRANAALNQNLSPAQLTDLAAEDNNQIQTNALLNKKLPKRVVVRLAEGSHYPGVRVLAKREIERRQAASQRQQTTARERRERLAAARAAASSYSSYSYAGKGGGKY